MVFGVYGAFSNCNIELGSSCEHKEQKAEEPKPEPVQVEEPKPEPEPVKEPEPAPVVEEPKAEEKPVVEEKAEEKPEPEEPEDVEYDEDGNPFGGLGGRKERVPFEERLAKSSKEVREYYEALKKVLDEYVINDRFSIPGETFSFKREKLVFITFAGNTLKVYFALDPKEFADSTIPVKSAADVKKFEDTPSYLRIKSNLATRRAIYLVRRICTERRVPRK